MVIGLTVSKVSWHLFSEPDGLQKQPWVRARLSSVLYFFARSSRYSSSYRSWQATLIFYSRGGASGGEKAKKLFFSSSPRLAPRGSDELQRFRLLLAIKRLLWRLRENAVVAYRYFKNSAFTAVNRNLRFSIAGVKGYHFSQWEVNERGPFLSKIVCKGKVIFYRRAGGGEDLGLNKVKFGRSPLWMLLHWSDPP